MRFYLLAVSARGYSMREAFDSDSLQEAACRHVSAYRNRKFSMALVMRAANGKRYSVASSELEVQRAQ